MSALLRTLHAPDVKVRKLASRCNFPTLRTRLVELCLNVRNVEFLEAEVLPALTARGVCGGNDELCSTRRHAPGSERKPQTQNNKKVSHAIRLSHAVRRVHGGGGLPRSLHAPQVVAGAAIDSNRDFPPFVTSFRKLLLDVLSPIGVEAEVVPALRDSRTSRRDNERTGCSYAPGSERKSNGKTNGELGHPRSVSRPLFAVHGEAA